MNSTADLLRHARRLAQHLHRISRPDVAERLDDSVIRPLAALLPDPSAADPVPENGGAEEVGEQLWSLAMSATRLSARRDSPSEALEATAALQDLAMRSAPDADRLRELTELTARVPAGIRVQRDGPYLVTGVATVRSWLGEPLPVRPVMALCRCGASGAKPLCDGSHARVGFTGAKDPKRVPDRRDAYVGLQVTVLDNRGTCAHSGFCTDRLATVFHLGEEPFVAPSGGRMDEIVRAVRACPSGALSYAIDGREAREQVDSEREPAIEVSRDGPYRITGGLPLTDDAGDPEPRNQGGSEEHYSLCRCGHSQNKPFCSGMHWHVQFRDPEPSRDPTLFEWAGGFPALNRMTRTFYEKYVPEDPLLAPLFANMSPDHPERVAAWLGETFGGPKVHTERYGGYDRMVSQHMGKALTEGQRARWAQLMCRAADDAGMPADPEFRAAFVSYIEWGSRIAVENSTPGAHPPPHMPVPRWSWVNDATPGARVSALAAQPEAEEPLEVPAPDETVTFEEHVRPLFRSVDRQSMSFAFDLWSAADVRENARAILERLEQGTMPCDGAWAAEKVDLFRRWVESGAT